MEAFDKKTIRKPIKILVTGDRYWDDYETVLAVLSEFPPGTILIHGACDGADIICGEIAKALGFIVRDYPANWNEFGKRAGPIRNQQMINVEHTVDEPFNLCIAFHNNIKDSKGTFDMMKRSKKANIMTLLKSSC